jgi:hypothetical protein
VEADVVSNSRQQQGKGYSLIYDNKTLPGHSGGPVWNDRGELIAIHGQGDVDRNSQATINADVRVKTGFNLGITVNTFTKLATVEGIDGYAPDVVADKGAIDDYNRAIAINPRVIIAIEKGMSEEFKFADSGF